MTETATRPRWDSGTGLGLLGGAFWGIVSRRGEVYRGDFKRAFSWLRTTPPYEVRSGLNVLDAPRCETLVATVSRWSLILQPDSYA